MYTECLVQWTDEDEEEYVIIKDTDYDESVDDEHDSLVFFYGLTRAELEKAMNEQTVMEDGWVVKDILGEFKEFDSELVKGDA